MTEPRGFPPVEETGKPSRPRITPMPVVAEVVPLAMNEHRIPWGRGFLPGALLIFVTQALLVVVEGWPAATGEFWGPDSYMRLARTLTCRGGSACPEGLFTATNAPFGEVLHWPFLMDRLLLAGATPLAPLLGWRDAIMLAGSLFGPLLAIGAVALVLLAARSLVPRPGLYFVGFLFACQPWVFQAFSAPRVDHHGLQGFFFLAMVAGAFNVLVAPGRRRWAILTGAALGLALWVSTEGLVSSLPILVGLGLFWALRGGRDTARANRDVAFSAVAVLAIGLLLDGPPGDALAPLYDRFSVVHLLLFSLVATFWWGIDRFDGGDRTNGVAPRLLLGGTGAAVAAAVMAAIFPDFFGGPMVEMDPRLRSIWLDHIREFLPLVSSGRPHTVLSVGALHLASFLLAAPTAIVFALRGDREGRTRWSLLLGALLWFAGLTVFLQGRWALYIHLLLPIPLGFLVGRIVEWAEGFRSTLLAAAVRVVSIAGIALFPFFFAVPLVQAEMDGEGPSTDESETCSASAVMPSLRHLESREGAGVVLAPATWGSEIVFRTGHRAVASTYHRNASGLLDSYGFMTAEDPATSRRIAAERRIDWVVMCNRHKWFPRVSPTEEGTLYGKLFRGESPKWLRPIALPDSLPGAFRILEVELERPQERGR